MSSEILSEAAEALKAYSIIANASDIGLSGLAGDDAMDRISSLIANPKVSTEAKQTGTKLLELFEVRFFHR